MSLIDAVKPIITSKTASVHLEISGTTDGRMAVIAKPVVGPVAQTAPQELHSLCAALATPIKVVGDPQEIEQALTDAITEQEPHRQSWAERASELEAQIAAAAEKDAKAKKGASTSSSKKADSATKANATDSSTPAKDDKKPEKDAEQPEPAQDKGTDDQPSLEL